MAVAGLLHCLHDGLVDAEGDGDTEQRQQEVGGHADEAEGGQRQQQQHGQPEHQAWLLGVPPVDQILNCKEEDKDENEWLVWKNNRLLPYIFLHTDFSGWNLNGLFYAALYIKRFQKKSLVDWGFDELYTSKKY